MISSTRSAPRDRGHAGQEHAERRGRPPQGPTGRDNAAGPLRNGRNRRARPEMLLFSESSCRPVSGGNSACIRAARSRRKARSRFITTIALRRRASVIGDLETVFQEVAKLRQLGVPVVQGIGVVGLLRQFEDVDRPRLGHQLIHLLLAVAGRLAHHQVGHFQERIRLQQMVAEGRLDQRAEIGGQMFFGGGNRFGRAAAKTDRHAAGRHDQLAGRELAEDAHHPLAGRLCRHGMLIAVVQHLLEPRQRICGGGGNRLLPSDCSAVSSRLCFPWFIRISWPRSILGRACRHGRVAAGISSRRPSPPGPRRCSPGFARRRR